MSLLGFGSADTPANCLYEEVRGTWTFYEGERIGDPSKSCTELKEDDIVYTKTFDLSFPNSVIDEIGKTGTWTMIYNQGFEVSNSISLNVSIFHFCFSI